MENSKSMRRKLIEDTIQQEDKLKRLCLLLLDYIDLLTAELNETAIMASLHGWKSSRVEEGKVIREKLEKLIEPKKEMN